MARFFQSLDSEDKQVKQKTAQLSSQGADGEYPGDRGKLEEIAGRVDGVLGSGSSFAKLAKRLIADLRRSTRTLDGGRLPPELLALFNDERFRRSAQLRGQAAEILRGFPEDSALVGGGERDADGPSGEAGGTAPREEKRTELDGILATISDEEKEARLLEYLRGDVADGERCTAALVLFSIYSRRGSADRMLWVLEEFSESLRLSDSEHARRFRDGADAYIAKIYACLGPAEHGRYRDALGLISSFSGDVAEYRLLQFQFFRLSLNPATAHPRFRLLHCVRQGDWGQALELYNAHGSSAVELDALLEFADLALSRQEFAVAFDALSYCRAHEASGLTTKIYALCVVLNSAVAGTPTFAAFLDEFKRFDQNSMLLKSQDPVEEILRAFYLFHMLDYAAAARIIQGVCGFECTDALRSGVVRMAEDA